MIQDIYDQIMASGGLDLSGPGKTNAQAAIDALTESRAAVESLPAGDTPGALSQSVIDAELAAIDETLESANAVKTTIDYRTDNIFSIINASGGVNRIENITGCDYLLNATGSLMGECDAALLGIAETARAEIKACADFVAHNITSTELIAVFAASAAAYKAFLNAINAQLDLEQALIDEMTAKMSAATYSKSLELAWLDPCAKGILEQMLPSNIKDVLDNVSKQ